MSDLFGNHIVGFLITSNNVLTEQAVPRATRDNNFSKFYDWLKSEGVDLGSVEITNFDDVGYGLKATRDLKVT